MIEISNNNDLERKIKVDAHYSMVLLLSKTELVGEMYDHIRKLQNLLDWNSIPKGKKTDELIKYFPSVIEEKFKICKSKDEVKELLLDVAKYYKNNFEYLQIISN